MSDSLWPLGLQHARPPCPSPTPGVHPNSCPSSQWCHPTISSSVISFSSCLQSFPASVPFAMSQFFASGGQRIGVSASASVLPIEYSGLISFRMDWLDLFAVQRTLKSLLQHHISKASILWCSAFFILSVTVINFTVTSMITKMKCSLFPKLSLRLSYDSNHFTIPESGFPMQVQWFLSQLKPIIMPHSGV